jgi:hypothetical protein
MLPFDLSLRCFAVNMRDWVAMGKEGVEQRNKRGEGGCGVSASALLLFAKHFIAHRTEDERSSDQADNT